MVHIEKIRTKALLALAPVLLFAALALLPSSAGAAECTEAILCDGGNNALQANANEPEGFGTSALAVNTDDSLRLIARAGETPVAANSNPTGYAFFGLQVDRNPVTSCGAGNEFATGFVQFADIQHATPSPVFANIGHVTSAAEKEEGKVGGGGPWPFRVRSDHCETEPGRVTIENVKLFFPKLEGAIATGTFVGTYEQPSNAEGANCPGGGIKLDILQPGVTVKVGPEEFESSVDNGGGANAFLCFVSANNYLWPETAPTWAPFADEAESEVPGIWKD